MQYFWGFWVSLCLVFSFQVNAEALPPHILMVHSYEQDLDWTMEQQQAFTRQLKKLNSQRTLRFSSEYLNTKRLQPTNQYIRLFKDYLIAKYQTYKPDLIYVTDDNAAKFILELKRHHFIDTPVVFSGVNNTKLLDSYPFKDVSGIYEILHFAEYVRVLSELFPSIETVYYVGDGSITDQIVGEHINKLQLNQPIKIQHIQQHYLSNMIDAFAKAPPGPIIMGTIGSVKNSAEQLVPANELVRLFSEKLDRPILVSMSYIEGALGGYLFSEKFGYEAANIAQQYLDGASSVSSIRELEPEFLIDYGQMKHFGLSPSHPIIASARLHNKPQSFFEKYQSQLFWLGQISIVLTIFITLFSYLILRQRNQLLKQQSIDPLTQLSNRLALNKDVVGNGDTFALLNINAFSSLNQFYGVDVGNRLLIAVGELLLIKSNPQIKAYRLNADQFGLLFSRCYSKQQITRFLSHIIEQFENTEILPEVGDITLTVCVGATRINNDRYIEQAYEAMSKGRKQQQRFNWYQFDEQKVHQQAENAKWVNKLKSALDEHRLVAYYQPIIEIKTGRTKSHEMLARIYEEDGTVITPNSFIDAAKRTQQYHRLTRLMIEQAIKCIVQKQRRVSVNLTMQDIGHSPTVDYLLTQIEKFQPGQLLTIEITETEGIENYTTVKQFTQRLKEQNCRLAIDDFGTGYSNFSHLLDLNADVLKLDGSLIQRLLEDCKTEQVVKLLVAFAHSNDMVVTAEFVDSKLILDKLAELDVDNAQGFYLGKPKPM